MDFFFNNIGGALGALSSVNLLLIMSAGVCIGIVLGALPGFGSSQSLALLGLGMGFADSPHCIGH